ncbi:MAG: CBS domain-containing protein [Candidatus Verstraetearchaeota archaeon]|nr:CBS domain-containing protein [Candidatus Verstraetearchaeota archaeon]
MSKTLREEFPSIIDVFYQDFQKHKHVSEIMSKEVAMIEENATMLNAAKIMGKRHIGSLLVKGPERPAGIVTERDLLTRVIAANKDPKKVKVFAVMSPRLITIKPQATIREAARTMIKEKGRLVVMEERKLAGIVTASDLIRSLPEAPETSTVVSKFMTRQVESTTPNAKVLDIAKKMGKKRIGSVIVNKEGKPWGIFTERDLLTKVIYMGGSLDEVVEKYSSTPLIAIEPDYSIHKAAKTMAAKHVRRLPVFEGNKLAGIITARDLVEAYAL